MPTKDLVEMLWANRVARLMQKQQYKLGGVLHTAECTCDLCKAISRWENLPWWKRVIGRVATFVTYRSF